MSDNNTEDKEHNIIICGPQKENLTIKQFLQKKRFEELYDPVNRMFIILFLSFIRIL